MPLNHRREKTLLERRMYKALHLASFLNIMLFHYSNQLMPFDVKFYEHGKHVEGENISFIYNGIVPAFTPIYQLNVTPTNEKLKPVFTHLRVEYYNLMSAVSVSYDPIKSMLHFQVKFPFVDTPIGVLGYSLPK